jgi:hypothetical protein
MKKNKKTNIAILFNMLINCIRISKSPIKCGECQIHLNNKNHLN